MKPEDAREVYQQYWLHARHQESQRLAFLQVHVALLAGAAGLLGLFGNDSESTWPTRLLLSSLAASSLIGYALSLVWGTAFVRFSRLSEKVAIGEFALPPAYQRFASDSGNWNAPRPANLYGLVKPTATRIFMVFYSLSAASTTTMLCLLGFDMNTYLSFSVGGVMFLGLHLLYALHLEPSYIHVLQTQFLDWVKDSTEEQTAGDR